MEDRLFHLDDRLPAARVTSPATRVLALADGQVFQLALVERVDEVAERGDVALLVLRRYKKTSNPQQSRIRPTDLAPREVGVQDRDAVKEALVREIKTRVAAGDPIDEDRTVFGREVCLVVKEARRELVLPLGRQEVLVYLPNVARARLYVILVDEVDVKYVCLFVRVRVPKVEERLGDVLHHIPTRRVHTGTRYLLQIHDFLNFRHLPYVVPGEYSSESLGAKM